MSYLFLLNRVRNTLRFFSLSSGHTTNLRRRLKEEWYHCRVCFAMVIVAMATACCATYTITCLGCVLSATEQLSWVATGQPCAWSYPGMSLDLKAEITAVGIRWADHATHFYPQKLALSSPTSGGRSVGIVRSQNKATELLLLCH
jgi:hypothetical protein